MGRFLLRLPFLFFLFLPFLILLFSWLSLLSCFLLLVYILTSSSAILHRRRLYARRSLPSSRSAVYDLHCDYQHCLPSAPAFCSCTTRNAMRSVTTFACLMRPTPRTSLRMRHIAPDALLRPCPPHQAPAHPIYDKQQALSFLDARAALVNQRA
jgi:hypothetical protein